MDNVQKHNISICTKRRKWIGNFSDQTSEYLRNIGLKYRTHRRNKKYVQNFTENLKGRNDFVYLGMDMRGVRMWNDWDEEGLQEWPPVKMVMNFRNA
jgi:hypothetical protein